MRTKDPHRLELTEYFSTALWHLQEEVELSVLAQELTRIDKCSPQAWCAAGNCFSIQKEHENAIKFFQRAVQVTNEINVELKVEINYMAYLTNILMDNTMVLYIDDG